jgi:hypothetical protein
MPKNKHEKKGTASNAFDQLLERYKQRSKENRGRSTDWSSDERFEDLVTLVRLEKSKAAKSQFTLFFLGASHVHDYYQDTLDQDTAYGSLEFNPDTKLKDDDFWKLSQILGRTETTPSGNLAIDRSLFNRPGIDLSANSVLDPLVVLAKKVDAGRKFDFQKLTENAPLNEETNSFMISDIHSTEQVSLLEALPDARCMRERGFTSVAVVSELPYRPAAYSIEEFEKQSRRSDPKESALKLIDEEIKKAEGLLKPPLIDFDTEKQIKARIERLNRIKTQIEPINPRVDWKSEHVLLEKAKDYSNNGVPTRFVGINPDWQLGPTVREWKRVKDEIETLKKSGAPGDLKTVEKISAWTDELGRIEAKLRP